MSRRYWTVLRASLALRTDRSHFQGQKVVWHSLANAWNGKMVVERIEKILALKRSDDVTRICSPSRLGQERKMCSLHGPQVIQKRSGVKLSLVSYKQTLQLYNKI
jgi:hypothetical protein